MATRKVMDPRSSIALYPRFDQEYIKKRSLNFDMMKSEVFVKRQWTKSVEAARWVCYFLIGFFTGIVAFLMSLLEEYLLDTRMKVADKILESTNNN